jgi:urease accessory protein
MRVTRGPISEDDGDRTEETAGRIVVDETQRRRSRFRTRTADGEEVGVVVDGARVLSAGDVLETDDGERFVVELESLEALVVEFGTVEGETDNENEEADEHEYDPAAMVVAGHAVGNRHWDLVAHEGRVYVPTDGDTAGRRAFLEPYLPSSARITVESVEPSLFDEHEPNGGRGHSHGGDHAHSNGESDHDHGHGHSHADHDHRHTHTQPSTETTMTRKQLRRTAQEKSDE